MPDIQDQNAGDSNQQSQGKNSTGLLSMTQDQLNTLLANERRRADSKASTWKSKAESFEALQTQVSELLGSGLIDGVQDLTGFRDAAGKLLEQHKTDAQKAKEDADRKTKALAAAEQRATAATQRYEQSQIQQAISSSAGSKVTCSGALEAIQSMLGPKCKVSDDGTVFVPSKVKTEDGTMVDKNLTVAEAVAQMESVPSKYGAFFRATVSSGAGSTVVDGVRRTNEGIVDFANLSYAQFLELSEKQPNLIQQALSKIDL